eukprot:scaffold1000_cov68-Phaeocystis_antarctica.AAC.9
MLITSEIGLQVAKSRRVLTEVCRMPVEWVATSTEHTGCATGISDFALNRQKKSVRQMTPPPARRAMRKPRCSARFTLALLSAMYWRPIYLPYISGGYRVSRLSVSRPPPARAREYARASPMSRESGPPKGLGRDGRGGQAAIACNESLEGARLEVGQAVRGAPGGLGDRLLREEARRGDHAQARVRQLLLLHQTELGRVLRGEAERVEAEVARLVARAQRGLGLELLAVELAEGDADAVGLGGGDADAHDAPQPDGQARDLVDGGATVRREERVELLLHEEAERGEHAHAAVGQLALTVAVDLKLGLALHETRRVPVKLRAADRVEVAREAVRRAANIEGAHGRLGDRRLLATAELHLRRDLRGANGGAGEGGGLDGGDGEHDSFDLRRKRKVGGEWMRRWCAGGGGWWPAGRQRVFTWSESGLSGSRRYHEGTSTLHFKNGRVVETTNSQGK